MRGPLGAHTPTYSALRETMARPAKLTVSALGLLAILAVAVSVAFNPASWPDSTLRAWLRRQTPYGTPEPQVRQFLESRGFVTIWAPGQDSLNRAIGLKFSEGTRTVQAHIGDYRSPVMLFLFVTSTEAFFGFDASSRLVDIRVRKSTDAL
jgi:hypothetical protein